jgi:antitoxin component YwqK of YwqJK toxin-antitoxin module
MVMRRVAFLAFTLFLWTGCAGDEKPKRPEIKEEVYRPLVVEDDNGKFTEWYPGHQQVKITGRKDKEGRRSGIWKYFSEQGLELSITVYNQGAKDGHTVVKYPNGAVHYSGEYLNDKPIGEWKFYNEKGQLTETKNYSK